MESGARCGSRFGPNFGQIWALRTKSANLEAMSESALITGASRGLGLFLAEVLVAAGFTVFAGYREPISVRGGPLRNSERFVPIELDVTDPGSVRAARDAVARRIAALDVLINNAAILPAAGRGRIDDTNIEIGHEVFDTNALGPLRVTQAFLPLLRAGTRKLLINVSSEAGSVGDCWRRDEHLYCMSKAALNMQTAILRNDLAPEGIEVLAVHPGWMRTDMGGPNADVDPKDAAAGILALVRERRDASAPYYIDFEGKPLNW
jgi:NAD(P)-dependent dehydrogenase (short-subunit alcohol dehydrogenase family)